jgi:uncharacterized protein (TIGR02145 family)
METKKSFNFLSVSILMLTMTLAMSGNTCAQVTIGENTAPQNFSVLELMSKASKGLRLPQMDSTYRNAMMETQAFKNEKKGKALGLQIFNTSTYCVETWNGTKWIEKCMPCDGITFPALGRAYNFCSDSLPTVADLQAKIGADIYVSSSGSDKRGLFEDLNTGITYYAEQRVANCVNPIRTPITVNIGNCSSAPLTSNITTFVNVMYDFQHQTIEAYTTGSYIGTDYLWEVSTDAVIASTFTRVPDAPNSPFFTVPANFSDNYNSGDYSCDTLWFRCTISNPSGSAVHSLYNALSIIFIKTTSKDLGYDIDANTGVRYLSIGIASDGKTVNESDGSTETIKVALLSLGQSADWQSGKDYELNCDAADLGDFYQWGRIADGHQNTVWSKDATHYNTILPYGTTLANTSDVVVRGTPDYDSNLQIKDTEDVYYGKFIENPNNWHTSTANDSLWGNGTYDREYDPANLSAWSTKGRNNNPCPEGWRIPSRWNFWDISFGTGVNTPSDSNMIHAKNNIWECRNTSSGGSKAIGGAIITNKKGGKIFLPFLGYRHGNTGVLTFLGDNGYYWSSTRSHVPAQAYYLGFTSGSFVNAGSGLVSTKSYGQCVRCVADF